MSNEVKIRPMDAADLPTVMAIENASYALPWSEATFRGLLRRTDADLVVAESSGQPVGYAASWFVIDQAELGNVAVAHAWRRRGVGARLIEAILERAGQRGAREVFLEVRPSNTGAQRLYSRYGFKEVGRRRNYYAEPPEDALVMKKEVGGELVS